MNRLNAPPGYEIDKKQISATVLFAINNIAAADRHTLQKFLELMNTTGPFGSISVEQFDQIYDLTLEFIPGAHECSLQDLIKLLGIHMPPAGHCQEEGSGDYYMTVPRKPKAGGGDRNPGSVDFRRKGGDHER